MAKKSFYPAIIDGELIGIFKTWEECKPYVTGIKGKQIHYAGFTTLAQALAFIAEKMEADCDLLRVMLDEHHIPYQETDIEYVRQAQTEQQEEKTGEVFYPEDALHMYVDGSYDEKQNKYSYGLYATKNGKKVYEENGVGTDKEAAAMRQVAGELLGVERAIDYAISQGEFEVVLFYDYSGVELWTKDKAEGGWKARNKFTQAYQQSIANYRNQIDIHFVKVKAHTPKSKSGIHHKGNQMADKLARQALGLK